MALRSVDLMIGDWVLCDNTPYQIAEIGGMVCISAEQELFAALEDIDPIPLTPEILEKNGFENKSERFRHKVYELVLNANTEDEHYLVVRLHPANENCDIMWANIYYSPTSRIDLNTIETKIVNCHVHELQHCLRLVGIEHEIKL